MNSSISIPNGTKVIKKNEYYGRLDIGRVDIPASVIRIEENAFGGCANLRFVYFSVDCKRIQIHPRAFYGTGLQEITLRPANIGTEPFEMGLFKKKLYPRYYGHRGVYEYPFQKYREEANQQLEHLLGYYDRERGGYMISGFIHGFVSTQLVIPPMVGEEPVIGIAKHAFKNCQLESIILPFTCRYIDEYAFEDAVMLEHIGLFFDPREMKVHKKAFAKSNFRGIEDVSYHDASKMKEEDELW